MSGQVLATNWLLLQGTEVGRKPTNAKVWGFIQIDYQKLDNTLLKAGPWAGTEASFNLIPPDLKTSDTFKIHRARIGVRGWVKNPESRINYFILVEYGGNGVTHKSGDSAQLTDASITINYLKGARVRIGQFKLPGYEEGLTAGFFNNYVNYSTLAHKLILERYFTEDGTNPNSKNGANHGVGGFRDIGIQIFDSFKVSDWEHSYAVMLANGNGLSRHDNDDKRDLNLYWSSEKIMGKGKINRPGLKLFAWAQMGDREIYRASMGEMGRYDRDRLGFGLTYYSSKMRVCAEYVKADGMIFNGTDGGSVPGTLGSNGVVSSFNVEPEEEADGFYVDFGYRIKPKWELEARYDVYNRSTVSASKESSFKTLTLGLQHFFTKKVILIGNYELRNADAPNLDSSATPNKILDGMDDQLAMRLTLIY
jgi:hypothetical protein